MGTKGFSMNIIGHRGNKEFFTENTLDGFNDALTNKQIDGVELDIHLTKDNQFIIYHDNYLLVNNKKMYIHEMTYKNIHELNNKIPIFKDFLLLLNNIKLQKKIFFEIKSIPFSNKNIFNSVDKYIDYLYQYIKKYIIPEQLKNIIVISFDYRFIDSIHKKDLNINKGLVVHRNLLPLQLENIDYLILHKDWITHDYIREIKQKYTSIKIYLWTVNKSTCIKDFIQIGIDGIVTDRPSKFIFLKKDFNE
jgi:glycerophosphoryl diester phosphodiesterase